MQKINRLIIVFLCVAGLTGCDALQSDSSQWSNNLSLYWSEPMERVDGSPLGLTEIMGYEIRYRRNGENRYTSIFVDGYGIDSYHFDRLPDPQNLTIEIAVIDNNGIYSEFVTAN